MPEYQKKVAIIGAGAAGLPAIKSCLDAGLLPFCFDKEAYIGGQWNLKNKQHVLKSTLTNVSKELSSFSNFLFPKEFPNFMKPDHVLSYFEMYTKEFALHNYIHLQHEILLVKPCYDDQGKVCCWKLDYSLPTGEIEKDVEFEAVIVATGFNRIPYIQESLQTATKDFTGEICHSAEYQDFEKYRDKTVVICGVGNSGGDISVELSYYAKQVYWCTRHGSYMVRRYGNGGAPQDCTFLKRAMPDWLLSWLSVPFIRLQLDHKLLGLQPKDKWCMKFLINDELPVRIGTGQLLVKPGIASCCEKVVTLDDGTTLTDVDAIICSTGFKESYPFIPEDVLSVQKDGKFVPLFKYMFPTKFGPSLSFVGCLSSVGSNFPIFEMQARYIAAALNGKINLPSQMEMDSKIQERLEAVSKGHFAHSLMVVKFVQYLDELAIDIGAKPDILKTLILDWQLGWHLLFGPCIPAQYRLKGPNSWPDARKAILEVDERIWYPVTKGKHNSKPKKHFFYLWILIFAVIIAIIITFC